VETAREILVAGGFLPPPHFGFARSVLFGAGMHDEGEHVYFSGLENRYGNRGNEKNYFI
jgi:hypothetical protein